MKKTITRKLKGRYKLDSENASESPKTMTKSQSRSDQNSSDVTSTSPPLPARNGGSMKPSKEKFQTPDVSIKTLTNSKQESSFDRNDSLLSNGSCDGNCQDTKGFSSISRNIADRRGTSFSSNVSSEVFGLSRGSFASFSDFISNISDDSRSPSLDSLSHRDASTTLDSAFLNEISEGFNCSPEEDQIRKTTDGAESGRKTKTGSGIWKKLPFHKKVHPSKSIAPSTTTDENHNALSTKTNSNDLKKKIKTLQQLEEENNSLKIMVRDQGEEVRMLNAAIDQVNQTMESKIQEVQEDLEDAHKQNTHLRAKLVREVSQAIPPKPAIRIPVTQDGRNKPSIPASSTSSDHHSVERASVASSHYSSDPSSVSNQRRFPNPNRKKQTGATRPYDKTDDVKKKLFKSLSSSSCLSQLSVDDLCRIAEIMTCKRINKGERLMQEGLLGHTFFILEDGECAMYKKTQESSTQQTPAGRPVKPWEIFGDSDVFYNSRRVWSCRCVHPGVVWYITKREFQATIMQQDIQRRRAEISQCLQKMKCFQNLKSNHFRELALASKVIQFANGDYIIKQGSKINHVFILKEGEVTTTKIVEGTESRRFQISPGDIFGNTKSSISVEYKYNVIASGKEVVQCIVIPLKYFDQVRDDVVLPDDDVTPTKVEASLAKREVKSTDGIESVSSGHTGSSSSGYGSDMSEVKQRKTRYDPSHTKDYQEKASLLKGKSKDNFTEIQTIGRGGYGKVELASLKDVEGEVFALKKLSKYEIVAAEHQQNVFNEKLLQMEASRLCPFITSLYSTFKDTRFVYFAMEFCAGGELFSLLLHANSFDDNMARFYAGCVVEALGFLHTKHIIFRDLKPENVVFDKQGYCKLTDFGFAKKVTVNSTYRTYTFCGTPEYMAPEILSYQAQSFSVDLWTLGIFIFEMLNGKAPFKNKNRDALAAAILGGIDRRLEIAKDAKRVKAGPATLIKALCRIRPEDRLGYGRNGISEVARHSWFHKLNWGALRNRTLSPPWKPKLESEEDVRYFSPFTKKMHHWNTSEEFSGWDENF